ncbi:MAG: zinc ribbon domain-containing protein, partial [Clostridiales bacterium]|nr:zinc ribbon domain-containing protein [Clostridiales bacterium]
MICRRCGAEIPDGSDFCAKCGARQTVKAVPTDKKPGGIRELILKFVSKGLILFFMLVVFATSFAGVYKVDGNAAPGVYLKGVEISQSSVQAFAAMVSRYDEDEVSEIYAELQAEVAAIVGNLGAVTSFSASQKRELSEMFSRYNIMKMTISILEIQEDNAAASFSIETLASLESARYTVNLIGALSALHILIAAAGFALAVIDLVFFILNVFAKHKHTQLIGKFAQYAAAASLVAAIMLSLAVTGGGVVYGGALITALVVCPIAMALTFVLDRLTNRTPFALKTLVPQLSAVVGALILVAVFANTSTFSVSVKSASGEGVAARSFVFGILP